MTSGDLDLAFLDESADTRARVQRARRNASLSVPAAVTVVWLGYVTIAGHWGRVADHVGAAITMVFGSFVAGSTPQGGGAVAFPVFTKVLDVPSAVARSFSLSIQAVGMGSAALVIVLARRRVVWRAVAVAAPAAVAAFAIAVVFTSDRDTAFWVSRLPGPYVKVTFTLVLAGMAWLVFLGSRIPVRKVDYVLPRDNARLAVGLAAAGTLGGVASALVGSGADVFVYLAVVVLFGIDPRIGVPTSVVVMATVSVVGLVILGIIDGQLSVDLADGRVVGVGGTAIAPTPLREADLFGMWIAAIPIVAWGAPLGSYVASRLRAQHLVFFVLALAVAEVLSTIIFVDELRSDSGLIVYAVVGVLVVVGGLAWLARNRRRIFDLPAFSGDETLRRSSVDTAVDYARSFERDPD